MKKMAWLLWHEVWEVCYFLQPLFVSMLIPKKLITNESGQAKDRQAFYVLGGVFCFTSHILITDLLTNVVTANEHVGLWGRPSHR